MFNLSHSPIQNLSTNMKIPISNLLLTIAIFQQFGELNATEPGEGSSTGESRKQGRPQRSVSPRSPGQVLGLPRTRPEDQDQLRDAVPKGEVNLNEPGEGSSSGEPRKRGRPRGTVSMRTPGTALGRPRGSLTNQEQFRIADPNDGPPHRLVYYGLIEIQVWLAGPLVRKAIFPKNYIPQGQYYRYHNFLIRTLKRADVMLVAYISQMETLTGVRPPEPSGLRYDLEPTTSVWYINYGSTHLKVKVTNSAPTEISLMPENVHVPAENDVEVETVAGITFRLFRERNGKRITGAEFVSYAFMNA